MLIFCIIILYFVLIFNIQMSFTGVIDNRFMYHEEPKNCYKNTYTEHATYPVSLSFLIFMIILMTLLCLVLLGVLKGLLGLSCCAPIGMWGLGSLIDMPRPLESYQESSLEDIPVKYDLTGWPVHPHTGKRSVRALTKKTEFFLNVVFFLAYPLAMIITLISACCFKETDDCDDNQYFQCENIVVFNACTKQRKNKVQKAQQQNCKCKYGDEDSAEDKDTNYVVYQMHRSQQSLHCGCYNN